MTSASSGQPKRARSPGSRCWGPNGRRSTYQTIRCTFSRGAPRRIVSSAFAIDETTNSSPPAIAFRRSRRERQVSVPYVKMSVFQGESTSGWTSAQAPHQPYGSR